MILSLYPISPGVLMMLIIMFSTMLTALGIVREKELGSITNLYASMQRSSIVKADWSRPR